jgi:hypothetical protein
MAYTTLGSRAKTGTADTTGNNKGNWTVTFAPGDINVTQTEFEVYKIVVTGAAPSATFNVFVDAQQWDTAVYGTNNSWDPQQPLVMRSGQYLYFYYSSAATDGSTPKVTIWLRYQPELSQIYGVA